MIPSLKKNLIQRDFLMNFIILAVNLRKCKIFINEGLKSALLDRRLETY